MVQGTFFLLYFYHLGAMQIRLPQKKTQCALVHGALLNLLVNMLLLRQLCCKPCHDQLNEIYIYQRNPVMDYVCCCN
jgi:hypothetical protein